MTDVDVWHGPQAEISGAIDQLVVTDSCPGREETLPLACRADYERAVRASGLMGDEELTSQPLLAAAVQAHWHMSGSNGCTFAAFLSEHRLEYGWETHVVSGSDDPRELAFETAAISERRLQEPEVEVISILYPELDDEAVLATLLARLDGRSDWETRREGEETDEQLGALVRLGVRTAVEFDHWSEVLGFGRFAAQPNTRLAPFTEMAIRAKPPKRRRPNQRAYMADIDTGFERDEVRAWWRATEEERLRRLGPGQDLRGKAKVTFSLRESVWTGANS